MNNFLTRIISGAVYVGLIFCAVYFFNTIPAIFLVVFGIFTLIGVREIDHLTDTSRSQTTIIKVVDALGALAVFVSFYLDGATNHSLFSFLPVLLYGLTRMTTQLYTKNQNPITSLQRSFFNICYVALPLGLMSTICFAENSSMLFCIFIFLWLNDSGAYLVGSTIGMHRLFERISPKKSWEGFWGGLILSVLAGYLIGQFLWNNFYDSRPPLLFAGLGLVVSIFGTLGDLTESLLKRTAGVKDSSNLIPGHGGILDRIDSLLFAVPAALIYLAIIKNLL